MGRLAQTLLISARVFYYGSIVVGSLIALAGVVTLVYVRVSQRASLRQVWGQLAEISAELRRLREGGGDSREL
jgi:hypothetical protein